MRWFRQRVELLRERNRLEAIVRAQAHEIAHKDEQIAFWKDAHDRALRMTGHRRSTSPASMGEHKGRHYCVACTVSVDDFTAYVDWPCGLAGPR